MVDVMEKPKRPREPKSIKAVLNEWTCSFCKKSFSRESSYINHACEKKRRWLWRDEKYIKIGFIAFQKFFTMSMKSKKPKTYDDFMDSKYFTSFTKFGRHVLNINAIDVEGFIEFLIKGNIKLDNWTQDIWYETWIRELTKKESPHRAVERNILLMEQWARENGEDWVNFFRKVPTTLATKWIRTGRISPWLLYSGVGQPLFDRMTDEQLGLVKEWINPLFWLDRIRDNKAEVDQIRGILTDAGV